MKENIITGTRDTGDNKIDAMASMIGVTNSPILVVTNRSNLLITSEKLLQMDNISIVENNWVLKISIVG
jgi:hypothetical protein